MQLSKAVNTPSHVSSSTWRACERHQSARSALYDELCSVGSTRKWLTVMADIARACPPARCAAHEAATIEYVESWGIRVRVSDGHGRALMHMDARCSVWEKDTSWLCTMTASARASMSNSSRATVVTEALRACDAHDFSSAGLMCAGTGAMNGPNGLASSSARTAGASVAR